MTPTPAVLDTLLARVRSATGPDTRLDWDILDALFLAGRDVSVFDLPRILWAERRPSVAEAAPFTGSLDAAVALVEAVLPGAYWDVQAGGCAWIRVDDADIGDAWNLATPALALCAALLTALLAQTTP